MSEKPRDELLVGNYDGIQEYDNDLPKWWVYLFVLTVVLSVVYIGYVHVLGTPSDVEVLSTDLNALEAQRQSYQAVHAPKAAGPEALLAMAADPIRVERGKSSFAQKCAACHGQRAEGLVGPNLTDEFWLHGSQIDKVRNAIANGIPEKGMMAWKSLTSQEDMDDLVVFIWSIRNTNVQGKAPQGEKG